MTTNYIKQEIYEPPLGSVEEYKLVIHSREAKTLVIFIHGLMGSAYGDKSTWGDFPSFLMRDFDSIDIGLYQYVTGPKRFFSMRSIDIPQEAKVLKGILDDLPHEKIIICAHSMGGLLARMMISEAYHERKDKLLRRIVGLFMFAVPCLGSKLAFRIFQIFSPDARALHVFSNEVGQSSNTFADIKTSLAGNPGSAKNVPTWALVSAEDKWVSRASAASGISADQCRDFGLSHTRLCKPRKNTDDHYLFVVNRMRRVFSQCDKYDIRCRARKNYRYEKATSSDAYEIIMFACMALESDISRPDLIDEWLSVDPESVWIIRKTTHPENQPIVGYWCAFCINEDAKNQLKEGSLKGTEIDKRHLARSSSETSAIYVGGIVGSDTATKALAEAHLLKHLTERTRKKSVPILARPVTKDGLRLARRYGLLPVDTLSDAGLLYEGLLQHRQ